MLGLVPRGTYLASPPMMRRIVGILAAALAALALLGGSRSPAQAASGSVTTFMQDQAWYQELPPCVSFTDCSALGQPSPYPKDTLHVSIAGGQETARTYLGFSLAQIPAGALITGGTLVLPVDQDPADGSVAPDTANLQACLVTGTFGNVRGSTAKPPKADCSTTTTASYQAKQHEFVVSLTAFSFAWTGKTAALALTPSPGDLQAGATWHVVFFASTKPSKTAPPITATLTYFTASAGSGLYTPTGGTAPAPVQSGGGGATFGGAPSGSTTAPSFGGSFLSNGQPSRTTRTTTTTVAQGPAASAQQPQNLVGFAGPGFAFPIVWALPLLLLVGFGAVGRALTKELYRRGL